MLLSRDFIQILNYRATSRCKRQIIATLLGAIDMLGIGTQFDKSFYDFKLTTMCRPHYRRKALRILALNRNFAFLHQQLYDRT